MDCPEAELSLVLVNDPAMARYNQTLLQRRGPTNVIAVPLRGGPFPEIQPQMLGDVIISLETTRRQAKKYGWRFLQLLDLYLIHGILHLLGYDHEAGETEALRMAAKTQELFKMLYPELEEDIVWPDWK
ncbi:MAG: rRNA maturation RNase YbeY [Desulfobacca sp.]|uniref:rRNA maturation RNase YbeY n=1 Tax=Desulfobacca sp. TaxID=2067990 RepID=UPI00404B7410